MSWKDQKVRMEAICMVATVLEAILMDDEAFARACRRFTSMENADNKGNMDEAAAEKKKLIGLLKDSKLRSWKDIFEKGGLQDLACSWCHTPIIYHLWFLLLWVFLGLIGV